LVTWFRTTTVAEPCALFQVAAIWTRPALRPSTSPPERTVATLVSELNHATSDWCAARAEFPESMAASLTKRSPPIVAKLGATVNTEMPGSSDGGGSSGPVVELHATNRVAAETMISSGSTARMATSG
jgi:hypothetical protein